MRRLLGFIVSTQSLVKEVIGIMVHQVTDLVEGLVEGEDGLRGQPP